MDTKFSKNLGKCLNKVVKYVKTSQSTYSSGYHANPQGGYGLQDFPLIICLQSALFLRASPESCVLNTALRETLNIVHQNPLILRSKPTRPGSKSFLSQLRAESELNPALFSYI